MSRPSSSLVTDRANSDVTANNSKGNYNISDLNRIQEWQTYIAEILNSYDYYVNITPHSTWLVSDYIRQSDIDKIKTDTNALKNAYYTLSTTPSVTTGVTHISYTDANNIEKILYDIDYLISHMTEDFIYCGVPNCGQTRVWQQRFRRPRRFDTLSYNTLASFPSSFTLANISTQSDSAETSINNRGSVYGTMLYINSGLNTLDELIGGING